MEPKRPLLLVCLTLVFATKPVLAHHSLEAEFNPRQTVTLQGTVTKIVWSNPHVHLFLDVKDASNKVNWEVEMGSPNAQMLRGWKLDTIKPGDRLVVSVYRARDGSHLGFARNITIGTH